MNTKTVSLKGVIVPAITPVNERDGVDQDAFGKVIRRLVIETLAAKARVSATPDSNRSTE